jgi:hypothetical protein
MCYTEAGAVLDQERPGMLPEFTEDGLLPAGIHRATFEEFENRFVYFDRSDRRYRLFGKLRELYFQAKNSDIIEHFLVGGSFDSSKPEPNDFDCILVFDPAIEDRAMSAMEYNLLSRPSARRIFGGDVIAVTEGTVDYHRYMTFFQHTRDKVPVGIVEIDI